jgi:hypothetical protein
MARMLASDVVDLWFPVVLIKDYIYSYIIGMCCFFANHSVSRSKKQDELTWNQDNASEWGDMSTHGLFFKWASTIKIKLSALDYYKANIIITSLKCNLFSPWYSWKWLTWRLKNNHSLTQKFDRTNFEEVTTLFILIKIRYLTCSRFTDMSWSGSRHISVSGGKLREMILIRLCPFRLGIFQQQQLVIKHPS